jgi:DNA-binding HxlR family transcriptional regulator
MSLLMIHHSLDFNALKEALQVTDGNLASHINGLEKEEYLVVKKEFVGKKPRTSFKATSKGKKAFSEHLDALEKLIKLNIR